MKINRKYAFPIYLPIILRSNALSQNLNNRIRQRCFYFFYAKHRKMKKWTFFRIAAFFLASTSSSRCCCCLIKHILWNTLNLFDNFYNWIFWFFFFAAFLLTVSFFPLILLFLLFLDILFFSSLFCYPSSVSFVYGHWSELQNCMYACSCIDVVFGQKSDKKRCTPVWPLIFIVVLYLLMKKEERKNMYFIQNLSRSFANFFFFWKFG